MGYIEDKTRSRMARDQRRFERIMASPPARGEMLEYQRGLLENVTSVALALEALDRLLIAKGILKDNELLDEIKVLVELKTEQNNAQAAAAPEEGKALAIPA